MATSIQLIQPTDLSTASRFITLVVEITDLTNPLLMNTFHARLAQTTGAPGGLGAGETSMYDFGGTFTAGFDSLSSTISIETLGTGGERATITIKPNFGLCPLSSFMHTWSITDVATAMEVSAVFNFDTLDEPAMVNDRDFLYAASVRATRWGWGSLITAISTYTFEADTTYTGARLQVTTDESLVADMGDQYPDQAYGVTFNQNIRKYCIMSKLGEWARRIDDPEAIVEFVGFTTQMAKPVFPDRQLPGNEIFVSIESADQFEGTPRYYSLFILVPPSDDAPDWRWVFSDAATFAYAIPYGRYGHAAKMFSLMPTAWQALDGV